MAANTKAFSHLLAPGLRKVFFDHLKRHPEEYSKIANVETSSRAFEEEMMMAGLGRFIEKPEGQPLTYDTIFQGNKKRYTHKTFALGFAVTREQYDDDLYSVFKKMSAALSRAAAQTVELEFGALLDDAFDGNIYTGADGEALCASHTLTAGGSYSNVAGTATDLGIGALRAASERHERVVDERGLPANIGRGKLIVVTPTYQWVAKEIIGSEYKPYTADNEINAFNDMGLAYMVSHYMSDDDMWFLFGDKSTHDVKWFWREKPKFDNEDDFTTKTARFSGWMRFSLGFTDWRGVDGSAGAA